MLDKIIVSTLSCLTTEYISSAKINCVPSKVMSLTLVLLS